MDMKEKISTIKWVYSEKRGKANDLDVIGFFMWNWDSPLAVKATMTLARLS